MNFGYIQNAGDLKREVWHFSLAVGCFSPCIRLEDYSFQTRLSRRHKKWKRETHWERLDGRSNNIDSPTVPIEVERAMRLYFAEQINLLPIVF